MSFQGWLIDRLLLKRPRFRRWLTGLLEGDRDLQVQLMHTGICVNTIREHGYVRASRMMPRSSFLNDESAVLLALAALLGSADAFVDAGANVGVYTKILHRFSSMYPQLRYYAFEADPETASRLRRTLADTSATVFPVALAEREGSLEFVRGAVSHVSTRRDLATSYQTGETFTVACRRLDASDLVGKGIVLKIDVEGQEWNVLRGASGLFDANRILAVFLDGMAEPEPEAEYLRQQDFVLFDARTLKPAETSLPYALLAVHRDHLRHQLAAE